MGCHRHVMTKVNQAAVEHHAIALHRELADTNVAGSDSNYPDREAYGTHL
jgi:hypothetical protein